MTETQVYLLGALALVLLFVVQRKIKKVIFRTILLIILVALAIYAYTNGLPTF